VRRAGYRRPTRRFAPASRRGARRCRTRSSNVTDRRW
jgi:hypothetical protein